MWKYLSLSFPYRQDDSSWIQVLLVLFNCPLKYVCQFQIVSSSLQFGLITCPYCKHFNLRHLSCVLDYILTRSFYQHICDRGTSLHSLWVITDCVFTCLFSLFTFQVSSTSHSVFSASLSLQRLSSSVQQCHHSSPPQSLPGLRHRARHSACAPAS